MRGGRGGGGIGHTVLGTSHTALVTAGVGREGVSGAELEGGGGGLRGAVGHKALTTVGGQVTQHWSLLGLGGREVSEAEREGSQSVIQFGPRLGDKSHSTDHSDGPVTKRSPQTGD